MCPSAYPVANPARHFSTTAPIEWLEAIMSTSTQTYSDAHAPGSIESYVGTSPWLVLLGRILFSFIFLTAVIGHFSSAEIGFAAQQGVPMAQFIVPASGILAGIGALSILLGYHARIGAWLIVLFLIPVTLKMHNFWAVTDPMMKQMQMAHFFKNISMLGAALLITQFGSGPMSLDSRRSS
jgi:putative oxidoreductase